MHCAEHLAIKVVCAGEILTDSEGNSEGNRLPTAVLQYTLIMHTAMPPLLMQQYCSAATAVDTSAMVADVHTALCVVAADCRGCRHHADHCCYLASAAAYLARLLVALVALGLKDSEHSDLNGNQHWEAEGVVLQQTVTACWSPGDGNCCAVRD